MKVDRGKSWDGGQDQETRLPLAGDGGAQLSKGGFPHGTGRGRMEAMSRIVGIDLGTTNSLVATVDSGIPLVIADAEGRRLTPSVVHFPQGTTPSSLPSPPMGAKGT